MRRLRTAAASAGLAVLAGCATGYQDGTNILTGMTGGYWDTKGPGELVKVGFSGNGFVAHAKVGVYLMYRCAEVTKREGKRYFALYQNLPAAVMDKRSAEKAVTTVVGKPTTYAYILFFDAPATGLLDADEVIARLEPEVRTEAKK